MSKKVLWTIVIVVAVLVVGVGAFLLLGNSEKNIEGTSEEIMAKLYEGIPEENLPMMLGNVELNSENIEFFIGTNEVNYKEALASESMVGSIAHSVVLLRLNDAKEAKVVAEKIKETANPAKWICVQASNVIVKSKGDIVVLIMSSEELAPKLEANFNNL